MQLSVTVSALWVAALTTAGVTASGMDESPKELLEIGGGNARLVLLASNHPFNGSQPACEKRPHSSSSARNLHSPDRLSELVSWLPTIKRVLRMEGSSTVCKREATRLLRKAEQLDLQALHMLDSWAKLPSGLLRGNVNQLGDYDQCVNAGGRYCLAAVDLQLPDTIDRPVHAYYAMTSRLSDPGHRIPRFSLVHWAVCVPSACQPIDVQQGLTAVLAECNITDVSAQIAVDPALCHGASDPPTITTLPTTVAWCFFIIIFLLCLVGTALDKGDKQATKEDKGDTESSSTANGVVGKVLYAFSLRHNSRRLLNTSSGRGEVSSLHGARALNSFGLLLSHKQAALLFMPFTDRVYLSQSIARAWSMIGRAAILYTDSFILLSGILTSYTLLRELARTNRINIKDNLISRIIRLSPSLVALIVFCTFLLPRLGGGPLWGLLITKYSTLCQQHWWKNLLFIHNYFPFEQMCLTHSHQVGIDMQLFMVAPLLVYPLYRWPHLGLAALLVVASWSAVLRYTVALAQQLSTVIYYGIPISQMFRTAELTYILPNHRASVYCMGIAMGYLFHNWKTVTLSHTAVRVCWVAALISGLGSVFVPYHMSYMNYVYRPQEAALYNMIAPVTWSLFVAWSVFASHYGYAGWFGDLLCWRGFAVFTKISYGVYLTQFPIFFYNVGQIRTSQQYSFFKLFDLPEYAWVMVTATILTLMFELPAQNLKKSFFPSDKDVQKKEITEEESRETITNNEPINENLERIIDSGMGFRRRMPGM